jgi:hypothetical protein
MNKKIVILLTVAFLTVLFLTQAKAACPYTCCSNSDCGEGKWCSSAGTPFSSCTAGGTCSSASDCASGYECISNHCSPIPASATAAQGGGTTTQGGGTASGASSGYVPGTSAAASVGLNPTFQSNPTVWLPGMSAPQPQNPQEFATLDTATAIANLLGGTVVTSTFLGGNRSPQYGIEVNGKYIGNAGALATSMMNNSPLVFVEMLNVWGGAGNLREGNLLWEAAKAQLQSPLLANTATREQAAQILPANLLPYYVPFTSGAQTTAGTGQTQPTQLSPQQIQSALNNVVAQISSLISNLNSMSPEEASRAINALKQTISTIQPVAAGATAAPPAGTATGGAMVGGAAITAAAGFPRTVTVNVDGLNIRSDPSTTHPAIGHYEANQTFTATNAVCGASVSGENHWWVTNSGTYVWSGGTSEKSTLNCESIAGGGSSGLPAATSTTGISLGTSFRYLKVETTEDGWVAYREIEAYDTDGKKVKPINATASNEWCTEAIRQAVPSLCTQPDYHPSRVYDDDENTVWNAGGVNSDGSARGCREYYPQSVVCNVWAPTTNWIQLDYGSVKNFSRIRLLDEGVTAGENRRLLISNDGLNFTKLADLNNGSGFPYVAWFEYPSATYTTSTTPTTQTATYTTPTTPTTQTTINPSTPSSLPPVAVPQNCSIVSSCKDNSDPTQDCDSTSYDTSSSTVSVYGPQGRILCPQDVCHMVVRTECPEWERSECDSVLNEQDSCLYLASQRTSESGSFDISGLPISSATEAASPPTDAAPGSLWVAPAYRIVDVGTGGQFISGNDVWCKYSNQQLAIDCGASMVGGYCLPNWNPPGCIKK